MWRYRHGFNPRTLALAAQIRNDARNAGASTDSGQRSFGASRALDGGCATGGYTYTLEPGVYGQHTADEFWFDRKEGFCEHIASSFVLLMRAMGVPARVVTGYQGGDVNAVDGFWDGAPERRPRLGRGLDAAGQGWVRVDPTSAVAPARTGTYRTSGSASQCVPAGAG